MNRTTFACIEHINIIGNIECLSQLNRIWSDILRTSCNTPPEPIYLFGEVVEQWACCDGGDRLNGSPRSRQEKNENIERFTPQIPKQKTDCSTKLLMIFLFLCTLSSQKIFFVRCGIWSRGGNTRITNSRNWCRENQTVSIINWKIVMLFFGFEFSDNTR